MSAQRSPALHHRGIKCYRQWLAGDKDGYI
jgi:hypothetical protein